MAAMLLTSKDEEKKNWFRAIERLRRSICVRVRKLARSGQQSAGYRARYGN
jgi:hypothetical protein